MDRKPSALVQPPAAVTHVQVEPGPEENVAVITMGPMLFPNASKVLSVTWVEVLLLELKLETVDAKLNAARHPTPMISFKAVFTL
jgi:hypothetical protein